MKNQLSAADSLKFILGGKAIFTFKSLKSGKHFTYKVTKARNNEIFFVNGLVGSDNNNDYRYIGYIKNNTFICSGKSGISSDAPIIIAFDFGFRCATFSIENNKLEIYHEGKCCRCGRRLTTPESITNGIGPECANKRK